MQDRPAATSTVSTRTWRTSVAGGSSATARTSPVELTESLLATGAWEVGGMKSPLNGRFDWDWIGPGWIHPDEIARRRGRTPGSFVQREAA